MKIGKDGAADCGGHECARQNLQRNIVDSQAHKIEIESLEGGKQEVKNLPLAPAP